MPRKKTPDNNSGNNDSLNNVGSPATRFFNQYFSNLPPLPIIHSPYDGYVGFKFKQGNAFFKETPLVTYQVSSVGVDASFNTVKSAVFAVLYEDESPMLLFKLDWLNSSFFIWLPSSNDNSNRLCKAAKNVNSMITYGTTQVGHLEDVDVKKVLRYISGVVPHAKILGAGMISDEVCEYAGSLSEVHKDIDRFLRPGLSLLGEVPPLKSKEQLAQDEKEWQIFCQGKTKEEIKAIIDQRLEEQARRGGDLVYRNLLGATQEELLAMPLAERTTFMENFRLQREEKEAQAKAKALRRYLEMVEEKESTLVKPVAVKKTQKSKSKVKSKEMRYSEQLRKREDRVESLRKDFMV